MTVPSTQVIVAEYSKGRYLCRGRTISQYVFKHRHKTRLGAWYCDNTWIRIPFFFLVGFILPKIVILLLPSLTR